MSAESASTPSKRDIRMAEEARKKAETELEKSNKEKQELEKKIIELTSQMDKMKLEGKESESSSSLDPAPTLEKDAPETHKYFASMVDRIVDQSVQIDKFHGDGETTVHDWIDHVKMVADLKGWGLAETFRRARLQLRGPAAIAYRNFRKDINSLDQLADFLNKRFGVVTPKETYTNQLFNIKQGSQNGKTFINRFQKIMTAANVAMPGYFSDDHFATFFKQALSKPYLLEIKRAKAKTIDRMFEVVRDADSFLRDTIERDSAISLATERGFKEVRDLIEEKFSAIQAESASPVAPARRYFSRGFRKERGGFPRRPNYRPPLLVTEMCPLAMFATNVERLIRTGHGIVLQPSVLTDRIDPPPNFPVPE